MPPGRADRCVVGEGADHGALVCAGCRGVRATNWNAYSGPNPYGRWPVIACRIELGPIAGQPLASLKPGFLAQLLRWVPAMAGGAEPHAYVEALRSRPGASLVDVVADLATGLQRAAGAAIRDGEVRPTRHPGTFDALYGYAVADTGLRAWRTAFALIAVALATDPTGSETDPMKILRDFDRAARQSALDLTTAALVGEAERRGIPWVRPSELDRIVVFGQGCRQMRMRETITGQTSSLACSIARSKAVTNRILRDLGLPATRQLLVTSVPEAVRAARQIGYPVVVKPVDRGKGINVTVGIGDDAGVRAAAQKVLRGGSAALVEAVVPGDDHRLLVVKGKLVAAAQRLPGRVVGDGVHSIAELVAAVNRDPERGVGFSKRFVRLQFDDEAHRQLRVAGLVPGSVPARGRIVPLRGTANISTGGTAVDRTPVVHPDNRMAAERAARAVGLDIAGVDFITPDISRSWREVGGAICEVNPSPGLRPHWVSQDSPDATVAVMDAVYAPGDDGRIPIATVTGTNGKTTTTLLVAHILGLDGRVVGAATTDGVRIGGQQVAWGDYAGANGARIVLADASVQAAVLEFARRGLIYKGLTVDAYEVGAVLNVGSDHVGMDDIATVGEMAGLKRLVAAHARRLAVLNADDPLCVGMVPGLGAERVGYVSLDSGNPVVASHVAAGGLAVWFDGDRLLLHDGDTTQPLVDIIDIPIAVHGAARHNVQNAAFAALIAWGLGEHPDAIRRGLASFVSDPASNPGRCNLVEGLPFPVLIEFAHNAEAVAATAAFAARMAVPGRRIVVLWSHGNRCDEHYARVGQAAADAFDLFICTEPADTRGRPKQEIANRLGAGLRAAGVADSRIRVIPQEEEAVAAALAAAMPGDLVVICCKEYRRACEQVAAFRPASAT